MATDGGDNGGLKRLGAWAARRSAPRLWVSIAGAGCVLAVVGILVISGDAQAGDNGDSGSTAPGIFLCVMVVAAGYLLLYRFREAPAASAGVTAVVLGVPPLLYFLTFDEDSVPPLSLEAVLGLSALVWLVSYAVGPARGRPLLLGSALVFLWLFALQVIEDPVTSTFDEIEEEGFFVPGGEFDDEFDSGFDDGSEFDDEFDSDFDDGSGFDSDFDSEFDADFGSRPSGGPSFATLGSVTILFGGAYLVGARLLDRRGYAGTATPLAFAGLPILPIGILMLGDELDTVGTGLVLMAAGGLVAWLGSLGGRRVTVIVGATEVVLGAVVILGDVMEEADPTNFGLALFVLGGVFVAVAQLLHRATGEPPQTVAGPSTFRRRPPPGGPGAWPAPVPGTMHTGPVPVASGPPVVTTGPVPVVPAQPEPPAQPAPPAPGEGPSAPTPPGEGQRPAPPVAPGAEPSEPPTTPQPAVPPEPPLPGPDEPPSPPAGPPV